MSDLRNLRIPPNTLPIRKSDPRFPDKPPHLLAAYDETHIYLYRRQDQRHYPVPFSELLDPSIIELQQLLEAEARRQGLRATDVAKQWGASLSAQRADRESQEILAILAPAARALSVTPAELVRKWAPHAESITRFLAAVEKAKISAKRWLESAEIAVADAAEALTL